MVEIPVSPIEVDSPRPGPGNLEKNHNQYPLKKRDEIGKRTLLSHVNVLRQENSQTRHLALVALLLPALLLGLNLLANLWGFQITRETKVKDGRLETMDGEPVATRTFKSTCHISQVLELTNEELLEANHISFTVDAPDDEVMTMTMSYASVGRGHGGSVKLLGVDGSVFTVTEDDASYVHPVVCPDGCRVYTCDDTLDAAGDLLSGRRLTDVATVLRTVIVPQKCGVQLTNFHVCNSKEPAEQFYVDFDVMTQGRDTGNNIMVEINDATTPTCSHVKTHGTWEQQIFHQSCQRMSQELRDDEYAHYCEHFGNDLIECIWNEIWSFAVCQGVPQCHLEGQCASTPMTTDSPVSAPTIPHE